MPNSSTITVASVAAAVVTSSWAALIAATPAHADPLYDLCRLRPATDMCHAVFNVPVDPAIPPDPPDPDPFSPSDCLGNIDVTCNLGPYGVNSSSNPNNPSSPLYPHFHP